MFENKSRVLLVIPQGVLDRARVLATLAPNRRNPIRMARFLSMVVVTVLLFASVPVGAQQAVAPPP